MLATIMQMPTPSRQNRAAQAGLLVIGGEIFVRAESFRAQALCEAPLAAAPKDLSPEMPVAFRLEELLRGDHALAVNVAPADRDAHAPDVRGCGNEVHLSAALDTGVLHVPDGFYESPRRCRRNSPRAAELPLQVQRVA